MGSRRFVVAAPVQSAILTLVVFARRHFRERFEPDGRFTRQRRTTLVLAPLATLAPGPGSFSQLNAADHRRALAGIDREGHVGPFLELSGLETTVEGHPFFVQDLGIRGDLDRPLLTAGKDHDHPLVGIDFSDHSQRFEPRRAAPRAGFFAQLDTADQWFISIGLDGKRDVDPFL